MIIPQQKTRLPKTGIASQAVLAEMEEARREDWDWFSPKNMTASYFGGAEVAEVAKQAFIRHIGDNVVHQTGLHPSVRRYETEVIDMALDLFNAPEDATGTITTGGSESITLALKSARDRARAIKGIIAPEIVIPQSAYAVFNKLSHLLGIRVIQMENSPDFRADVTAMAAAITPNTIMLVGSAPPFPLCNVDPIHEIATLATKHDIWCHVDACIGGFMLPFARILGEDVPDFDFSVEGVTSISADFHKYGYAYRGCSILCLRDADLLEWQGFSSDTWNAGNYFSKNLAGSRNAGPIASAWAVFNFLGVEGFKEITAGIVKTRKTFVDGINAIDGLQIMGTPQGPHFSFSAEGMDIRALADSLMARGWGINIGTKPDSILLMLSHQHSEIAGDFLADLQYLVSMCQTGALRMRGEDEVYGIY